MTIRFSHGVLAAALFLVAGGISAVTAKEAYPMVGGAEMVPTRNVIENAVHSKEHTTLVAAVKAAGLIETLSGPGPFTVFAPTNAAFGKLPAGTMETLAKPENKPILISILTYHVVPGRMTSKELMEAIRSGGGKTSLKTVNGETLSASIKGGQLVLTDAKGGNSTVIQKDVMQSNGILYVVDTVLMP